MRFSRFLLCGIILFLFFVITGCSSSTRTRMMVDSMDPLMANMNAAVNKHTDVELVKAALPAALLQLDGFIEASPDNTRLLVKAAEGYNGYSFIFVEDKSPERAMKLYYRAFQYASRALKQKQKFAEAFDGSRDEFKASLDVFDKEDVPALFWTASSWLSWVGLNVDDPEIFLALPKIKAMLYRSIELDESYKYGMAHTVLGALYATRPVAHGGKPEKAKGEFDRAFEISQRKLLLFHLMYARYYTYQIQDRELFVSTLQEAIDAPDDLLPAMGFANAAAKRKAKSLLNDVDNIF
ncbi:MAG: TRAP transporter TatT component family protein [Desulfobacteraceae bacterium]|jgi:tetratricopeptide (TPR) repeat protein|nr:TRAP transporter TatT component family protein [Desulfobacteraceae bacterium]